MSLATYYDSYWRGGGEGRFGNVVPCNLDGVWEWFFPRLHRNDAILDFGCGEGALVAELQQSGFDVAGIDVSEAAIRNAYAKHSSIMAYPFNGERIPFNGDRFDVVIMQEVLEHLLDPRAALLECHRVLKPGGRLLLTTSWTNRAKMMLAVLVCFDSFFHPQSPHIRQFTPRSLDALLDECDFVVEHRQATKWLYGCIPAGQFVAARRRRYAGRNRGGCA